MRGIAWTLILGVVACAETATDPGPEAGVEDAGGMATSLILQAPPSVALGGKVSTSVYVDPAGATVSWSTEPAELLQVTPARELVGRAPGLARVTVTSDTLSASVEVEVLPPFAALAMSDLHACASSVDRAVFCWGHSASGQLGDVAGSEVCQPYGFLAECSRSPRRSRAALPFVELSGTCGLTDVGALYCWGGNGNGILSSAPDVCSEAPRCTLAPVALPGGVALHGLVAEGTTGCALDPEGAALCWGVDYYGSLGAAPPELCGTEGCSRQPRAVSGGHRFQSLTSGNAHFCGVDVDGVVWCWGWNQFAQLGSGAASPGEQTPVRVALDLAAKQVSSGGTHTCALTTDGLAYCWGSNDRGQVGTGFSGGVTGPVAVAGGIVFESLSGGGAHTCGLTASGDAYCWGDNSAGQLGDGVFGTRLTPTRVVGGHRFVALSAKRHYTCGRLGDGTLRCWGSNLYGQLGIGRRVDGSAVPLGVAGAGAA